MSELLDPAKLKVVELRAELTKRGLDAKGVKAALVKRLKDALEEELKEELPDTSIADTSTEECDTSQSQIEDVAEETKEPVREQSSDDEPLAVIQDVKSIEEKPSAKDVQPTEKSQEEQIEHEVKELDSETNNLIEEEEERRENGGDEESEVNTSANEDVEASQGDECSLPETAEEAPKGEKRKRGSPAPERAPKIRSKSPIKEDEPAIDGQKVQLSWYDSDLHLQVDKESFLSAKPYHDGAFGFAWAGVRATHGVSSGKVCFEVKITEELKWEDFSKYSKRRDDHKVRRKSGDDKTRTEKKSETDGKSKAEESEKSEVTSENDVEMKENTDEEKKDCADENDEEKEKPEQADSADVEMKESENPESNNDTSAKEEKSEEDAEEKKEEVPEEPLPSHLFRVGWSVPEANLQLGEDAFSYGYESSGRLADNKQFRDYGIQFGVGDVVASFLSIDEESVNISYAVNGVEQPRGVYIPIGELPSQFTLFPHVLSRNYAFELNLGGREEAWFAKPESFADHEFLDKIEDKVAGPARPENRRDCEVILMCGLPASGKTYWVQEHIQSHPDKRYTVIGNSQLLEKMTVSGDSLKDKYRGSWIVLLEKLQKSMAKLIELAGMRRRNYIIDQPNVYPSAQRRKMRLFEGFKRRGVVVVVGDEEQAKRQEAQDGNDLPESTLLDMKANMSLPQESDWMDEVLFVGLEEEDAVKLVQKYNSQARETIGIQRRMGYRDDRYRWNRRPDYRGGNFRDRNYHNRFDRGPPRQGNWRPGGWNRDRRDYRGPPMGDSRDWRNRGSGRDREPRPGPYYNRNRPHPGRGPAGGNGSANWAQSQGSWGGNQWGGQGQWSQGNWSNQGQQYKYGGGGGGGQGYSNWNYYGQYPQNWSQPHSSTPNQYGQYSQQDWAQYAQQYAQGMQPNQK